ncbi:hypothetical protein HHX47_DHR4000430 [Lentinula edodes]|nr:hypothetical protein HHX47_DHR4000430 [Lentinula edodes]
MAIIDGSHGGDEISQLWAVITELSDQLNQNRSASVSLYAQAGGVKNQALHSQTGFVLRKFNADKPKEIYDSELERMNAAMMAENQSLQHDNKQLNTLIKEYEQTLDTLMSERTRLSTYDDHENDSETEEDPDLLEREPWQSTDATHAEWALEREIELARLERENEELRNLIMAGRAIPVHAPQAAHPAPTQIKPQTEEPLQPSKGTDPGPQLATKVEEVKDSSTRDRPTAQPHGEEDLDTVPEGDLLNVDPYATVKRSKMGG